MQTRIRIETLKNGNKIYYPQYKGLFFWRYFGCTGSDYCYRENFSSLEKCQKFIDEEIAKQILNEGRRVSILEYVKYP
jgi:hypothetical protein